MMEPALEYIPQRAPMVMVDNILRCDPVTTVTNFTIREDNIFLDGAKLRRSALLEIIAQTCATRIGYLGKDNPVKIGVIGGVRDFVISDVPSVGDTVETEIRITSEVFTAVIVDAEVRCKGNVIAKCEMKVFVI